MQKETRDILEQILLITLREDIEDDVKIIAISTGIKKLLGETNILMPWEKLYPLKMRFY